MSESEFWDVLEFRICQELRGMQDKRFHNMWCDGITRDYVQLEKGATHFSGTIWIGYDGQTEMRFEMVAPTDFTSIDKIFWEEMLPREDVTAWLFVDVENECVTIDISNAEHINLEQVSNRE